MSCVVIYAMGMSLGYDIYEDIGLLYIRGQGEITQAEQMDAMLAWLREPQYEHCTDALFDLAGVKTTPKVSDLRELIAMLKQQMPARGPQRLAIVTSRPITFIIARCSSIWSIARPSPRGQGVHEPWPGLGLAQARCAAV